MTDSKRADLTQRASGETHLSESEAVRITRQEDVPELVEFVLALDMATPVSTDKAARLLKHLVKEQMSTDAGLIADQMRHDQWETNLEDGESLDILAERALAYLATHDGIALFNFFVKTFAETSGDMFP